METVSFVWSGRANRAWAAGLRSVVLVRHTSTHKSTTTRLNGSGAPSALSTQASTFVHTDDYSFANFPIGGLVGDANAFFGNVSGPLDVPTDNADTNINLTPTC